MMLQFRRFRTSVEAETIDSVRVQTYSMIKRKANWYCPLGMREEATEKQDYQRSKKRIRVYEYEEAQKGSKTRSSYKAIDSRAKGSKRFERASPRSKRGSKVSIIVT